MTKQLLRTEYCYCNSASTAKSNRHPPQTSLAPFPAKPASPTSSQLAQAPGVHIHLHVPPPLRHCPLAARRNHSHRLPQFHLLHHPRCAPPPLPRPVSMKLNSQAGAAKSDDPKPGEPEKKMVPFEGASPASGQAGSNARWVDAHVNLNRTQINGRPASPGSGAGHYPFGFRASDWVGTV